MLKKIVKIKSELKREAHPQFSSSQFDFKMLRNVSRNAFRAAVRARPTITASKPSILRSAGKAGSSILTSPFSSVSDNLQGHTGYHAASKAYSSDYKNRTSMIMELVNGPGALYDVLRFFWKYDVSITRIESRPGKTNALGEGR